MSKCSEALVAIATSVRFPALAVFGRSSEDFDGFVLDLQRGRGLGRHICSFSGEF